MTLSGYVTIMTNQKPFYISDGPRQHPYEVSIVHGILSCGSYLRTSRDHLLRPLLHCHSDNRQTRALQIYEDPKHCLSPLLTAHLHDDQLLILDDHLPFAD